jgi:acyl carrier protein
MTTVTCDHVIRVLTEMQNLSMKELSSNTVLAGPGAMLDSVQMMEILLALEAEFGIELKTNELFQAQALKTVGHLANFIDSKMVRN